MSIPELISLHGRLREHARAIYKANTPAFSTDWMHEAQRLLMRAADEISGLLDEKAVSDFAEYLKMPSEDKKAAVRYAWLRDEKRWRSDGDLIVGPASGESVLWGEALDKAIDAALNPDPSDSEKL